jgi:hypothetical protein
MPQVIQQVNRRGNTTLEFINPSTTQELLLMEIYKMLYEIKKLLEEEKNDKPRKSKKVNTD